MKYDINVKAKQSLQKLLGMLYVFKEGFNNIFQKNLIKISFINLIMILQMIQAQQFIFA